MDSSEWADWWDRLADASALSGSADLGALYLDELERHLTDEQIRRGTRQVILYGNHPSPNVGDIIEAATGEVSPHARAMDEWDEVLQMAKDWRRAKPSDRLSEAGQRALRQVNGIKEIALTDKDNLTFRRKDFISAYRTTVEAEPDQLPPMSEDGKQAIEDAMGGRELPSP